ncbi:hypothetical protein V6N11_052700 [Hibiscus sabdariffa]|uniref:Uncharacterized protein n=1 Tax=Hibiscus sabdariffa TaxID=183260 RepID=A0ABR2UAT9_9ROSI
MDGTNQAKDKSTTQSETNIEELLDSEGSDYCPSEHEASASEFFDNDNNHCDAADEISDGHVTGSVLESLGYHPTNIGYNSDDGDSDSDSDDDVESLHSLSSENSGTPSPEPSSSTVAPPITAPPTFSTVVPPTTTPLTRIIPKLPFKRPAQTIQVPSHSTPTKQRRKIKVAAGMQFSQVQPTQHQPTPYQVVRWMMQSTPCDNVLPNSQESTGNFKPKNN